MPSCCHVLVLLGCWVVLVWCYVAEWRYLVVACCRGAVLLYWVVVSCRCIVYVCGCHVVVFMLWLSCRDVWSVWMSVQLFSVCWVAVLR